MSSEKHRFDKIEKLHLARQIIISCSQLVEMMFHHVVDLYIKENSDKLCKCCLSRIETDIKKNIGIEKVMETWPVMLIEKNNKFDFSSGVFQSYKSLKDCRNKTIHAGVNNYDLVLANVAYNTALKASEEIWIRFFPDKPFKYFDWVEKMPARTKKLFNKVSE